MRSALLAGFLIVVLLVLVPPFLVEWLWMDALAYEAVFWKILTTQLLLFGVFFGVFLAYFGGNYLVWFRTVSRS